MCPFPAGFQLGKRGRIERLLRKNEALEIVCVGLFLLHGVYLGS